MLVAALAAASGYAQNANWAKFGMISPTTTLQPGQLCYTDGQFISCDGNLGAITGLTTDRITSGTTSVITYQSTSATIATNGVERLIVGTNGQVGIGQQPTAGLALGVNGNGSFSGNLGVGTIAPAVRLDVSGSLRLANGGEACDASHVGAMRFVTGSFEVCQNASNGWEPIATLGAGSLADRITSGTTQVITNGAGNSISFTVAGVTTGYFYNGQLVANGVSTTGSVSASNVYVANKLGVATTAPATALDVSGTLRIANGGETCDATIPGAIRYTAGALSYCNGTAWSTLANAASAISKLDDLADVEYNLTTENMFIGTSYSTPLVNNIRNMAIGRGALSGLTDGVSGTDNLAIGAYALNKNTTGYQNLAIGRSALHDNTTGYYNLAVGSWALYDNTTGSQNIAVGQGALYYNTTGYQNQANGHWALYYNTTGYRNLAIGQSALQENITGSRNAALGIHAGSFLADGTTSNTTPDNSIYFGAYTKSLADDSQNEIVIGYNATGAGSNSVVLGNDSITKTLLKGKVGLGTTAPATKLDVSGTLRIANGGETCDATIPGAIRYTAGALSYCNGTAWSTLANAASAVSKLDDLADVEYNLTTNNMFIGTSYSTPLVNNIRNMAIGQGALSGLTDGVSGTDNLAIGDYSLNKNTTGYQNLAVGRRALFNNTTGYQNLALGLWALNNNITGYNNIAVGQSALVNNTTGYYNLALGLWALSNNTTGDQNLAIGPGALSNNTTGSQNLASGPWALYGNITGSNNVALGQGAGRYLADGTASNTTPDNSLYLGAGTKSLADDSQNEIVIGYNATGAGSNSVVLGNDSIAKTLLKGQVGLGTTAPATKLDVSGTLRIANGGETCDATIPGAIRYTAGSLSYCNGTAWSTLTSSASAVTKLDDLSDVEYNLTTNNMFIGTSYTTPLVNNTGNVAVGRRALASLNDTKPQTWSGNGNTAIGYIALESNNSGADNTALGSGALYKLTSANQNTAIGVYALGENRSGYANIGVGRFAGRFLADGTTSNTTPDFSIYLGAETKSFAGDSQNEIVIGFGAIGAGSNSVVLGNDSITKTLLKGEVGLGTTAPATALDVSGTLRIADGGETCDATIPGAIKYASGSLSYCNGTAWSTLTSAASAVTKLDDLSDVEYNLTTLNMFIGTSYSTPLVNNTNNLSIGYGALAGLTDSVSGTDNLAIGYYALNKNTSGYYNLAVGQGGLRENTTGYHNFAVGRGALRDNTTGSRNLAVGQWALETNVTGSGNTALGFQAGRYLADGTTSNTTPDNSTYLGYYAKSLADNSQNEIVIGYNATGAGSNSVVLGNDSITKTLLKGKIGVATAAPATALDVSGSLRIANGAEACNSSLLGAIRYTAGNFEVCQSATNGWEPLATLGAGSLADRITSGTTQMIVYQNTSATIATNGVQRIVVGTTGNVGIGQQPFAGDVLGVSGTIRTNQTIQIGGLGTDPCVYPDDLGKIRRNPSTGRMQVCSEMP